MNLLTTEQLAKLSTLSTMSERIKFVNTNMKADKESRKSRYAQISEFLSTYCKRYVRYQWVYNVLHAEAQEKKYSGN